MVDSLSPNHSPATKSTVVFFRVQRRTNLRTCRSVWRARVSAKLEGTYPETTI